MFQEQRGKNRPEPFLDAKTLLEPLKRRKPTKWFWEDMSDMFGAWVPFEWIAACFGVMSVTPHHTHQVLTKRGDRLLEFSRWCEKRGNDGLRLFPDDPLDWRIRQLLNVSARRAGVDMNPDHRQNHGGPWPLPNVWLGVSVENRAQKERIDQLRQVPAAVRFLSIEPLLENLGELNLEGVHWVIVGGESGIGARPMHPDWVRSIRDQCVEAGVAYFFKQWGSWSVVYDRDKDDPDWRNCPKANSNRERYLNLAGGHGFHGERVLFVRNVPKKEAGRELDGRTWDEFPEVCT
jgi:protein gp37